MEAQHLLIHCSHALNRQAETLEGIAQFKKRWPKDELNEKFSVMAAVIRYNQGDFAGALTAYKELSNSKNQQMAETGLYYQGQCLLQLKQEEEAFKSLKVLAERPLHINFPYRAYAAFYIAGELLKQGDNKTALELYRKIGAALISPTRCGRGQACGWPISNMRRKITEALGRLRVLFPVLSQSAFNGSAPPCADGRLSTA